MKIKNKKIEKESKIGIIYLSIVVALMFFPFYMMLIMSLKNGNNEILSHFWTPPVVPYFGNYLKAWQKIYKYFGNSFWVSSWAVVGVVFVSLITGFAFSKYEFRFKDKLYAALIATMAIPAGLLLIPNFLNIRSLGLYNTHFAIIITKTATASIMGTVLTKGYIDKLPNSIFESLRIDGASEIKIFSKMVIPLSVPVMITVGVMNFFGTFNDFMWPYVVLSDERLYTVPIAIAKIGGSQNIEYGVQMAGYSLSAIPLVIIFSFTMKWYIAGVTAGAVKA